MADALTGLRLLLVAPVALGLARPSALAPALLLTLIVVAIATDYFDGKVARATGVASPRGQLFDHATDFLFVTAGLSGAAVSGQIPVALPVLIVLAFSQYVLDSYWLHREKWLRMSVLGRWNGVLYFVPLVLIAVSRLDVPGTTQMAWALLVRGFSYVLLISTVASIVDRGVAPLRASRDSETRPRA